MGSNKAEKEDIVDRRPLLPYKKGEEKDDPNEEMDAWMRRRGYKRWRPVRNGKKIRRRR